VIPAIVLLIISFASIALLLWFHAEKLYESHRALKRDHPLLFKIIGFNKRHLDNRASWIRHFRIFIASFVLFGVGLLWFLFLAF